MDLDGLMILDHGDTVDIVFLNAEAKQTGLPQLLKAAASDGSAVHLRTGGRDRAFRVTRSVAAEVGLITDTDEDNEDASQNRSEPENADVNEPPRSGKGATKAAWTGFLTAQGLDLPDDGATRDHLIALWGTHTKENQP